MHGVFFRQCKLQMALPDKTVIMTTYLSEVVPKMGKLAVGKKVDLEPRGEKRTGPWEIVFISKHRMTFADVLARSQDHKHQREASDI